MLEQPISARLTCLCFVIVVFGNSLSAVSETTVPNACLKEALKYNFQSNLISVTNASKVISYRATVYLHCRGTDLARNNNPRTHYMLWFDNLETSISELVRKPGQQRRKKLPPSLVRAQDPENPTEMSLKHGAENSYQNDEDANSTIGQWYPLPKGPVQFDRFQNGSIASITFNKFDSEHQKLVSIKRQIVFAFQTAYPTVIQPKSIAEYDELGYHFTSYSYQAPQNGGLEVTKEVTSDDFIELQRDKTNGGILNVKTVERQSFGSDGALTKFIGSVNVEMASNSHPTQVYTVDEDVKAQVAVDSKSNLTLVDRLAGESSQVATMLRGASGLDWEIPEKPSDVLNDTEDPTDYIKDVFSKIEPSLYSKGIETILDEFSETPKDQSILKPLLRALQLEADLFYAGKTKVRKVYDMAMPLIKRQLAKCETMQSWSLCLSFLNLAVSASGQFADKVLLSYLQNEELPTVYRIQLLNMAIFMAHPSDFLVTQMIYRHREGEMFDDDELEFRNHLLLAIGSTASRTTVTKDTKTMACDYLAKVINDRFVNKTCEVGSVAVLALNAAGNLLSPAVVNAIPKSAARLIATIIRIAKMCRETDDIAINALGSITKLHSAPVAMRALMDYLNQADCQQKSMLVSQLMKAMHFDTRVWPARGINDIDKHFAALIMFHPEMLSCDPDTFEEYFSRKRIQVNSVQWQRTFGRMRVVTTTVKTLGSNDDKVIPPRQIESSENKAVVAAATSNSTELLSRHERDSGNGYSYNVYTTDWQDYDGMFVVIQAPSQFQTDKSNYPTMKSVLFDLTGGTNYLAAYMRAGFFTGKNAGLSTCKLFGRVVVNIQLGLVISILDVAFIREQTQSGFYGYTRLSAIGFTYMDLPQYTCNITIDQWSYAYQFALPVYTIAFGGFSLNMNADIEARATLYLWPSYCLDGDIGIMFKPYGVLAGNAFAEIANSYFGIGVFAQLYIDYYLELSMRAPDGCLRLYHGNDDMSFTINIYLKLPTFQFYNFNPTPSTGLITWNIFQWLLKVKEGGKWALFGWCPPSTFYGPDTPTWTFDTTG